MRSKNLQHLRLFFLVKIANRHGVDSEYLGQANRFRSLAGDETIDRPELGSTVGRRQLFTRRSFLAQDTRTADATGGALGDLNITHRQVRVAGTRMSERRVTFEQH